MIGPVLFASSWQELLHYIERSPGSPAFVDPGFPGIGSPFVAGSARIRTDGWSSAQLIRYARPDPGEQRRLDETDIPFAARLRPEVDDDLNAIDLAILRNIDARRIRSLLERIEQSANRAVREILDHVLDLAIAPCTVPELATGLGLTERTLQRTCIALAIPPPKTLMSLARIFTVERLAHWSGQPSGAVALAVGFSDRSNYRRLVRRTLRKPPSSVRRSGGLDRVAEAIVIALGGITSADSDGCRVARIPHKVGR